MRMIRLIYRAVRLFLLLYGAWNTVMRSRWLTVTVALVRMLRKRRIRNVNKKAALTFIDGSEPAIYRRKGWRRIQLQRERVD